MSVFNSDALPKGTQLQGGKFVIDGLFSDQGGFSLIYEGRVIRKVEDDFFGTSRVNIIEEDVIIKELYFRDKAERREGQTALTWHPKNSNDKELIQTFKEKTKSEAEKLARLVDKTPYIIVIYAAFEENNTVYLITKKIEGAKDFRSIIKGDKNKGIVPEKLDVNRCLRYILHVCEALKVVHNSNIIHLDIKPGNILRDNKDNAILIDFGISVSVETGQIKTLLDGAISRHYSPPEQGSKDKKNIGFYSDIYALGATMYFFFTGGHLAPEYGDLISSGETFIPPSHFNNKVSSYLDSVVIKCLSISFRDRYQTIEELIDVLKGEKKYNALVTEAHKALADKEYEKGIEAIVATEALIPLNIELHGLKHELQKGREKNQKVEENKKQLLNAETLIAQQQYKKAIDLLQLLPESSDIKNKIAYCEKQLLEQQLTKFLADAAGYERNNNHQKALDTYLEAKKLKQNDKEINSKIDSLGLLLVEKKEKEAISRILRDNEAISFVLSGYENQLLSFENLNISVEDYLQKYPQDNDTRKKWNAIKANQQKIRDTNEQLSKEKESDKTIISETKTPSSTPPPTPRYEATPSSNTAHAPNKENETDKSVNSETNYNTGKLNSHKSLKKRKKVAFWAIGVLLLLFVINIIGENEQVATINNEQIATISKEQEIWEILQNKENITVEDYNKFLEHYPNGKYSANVMTVFGWMYYNGEGVTQNYTTAKEWYDKAAEKGYVDAMYNLGIIYYNGQGVTQDYAKAKEWYDKAAEKGNGSAMFYLGYMYGEGLGVSLDYVKSKYWYEKAIEKESVSAMTNLGVIYHDGLGVSQDHAKAKYWYEKAAKLGDETAKQNLKLLDQKQHNNKEVVIQDVVKDINWYKEEARKGDTDAMNHLGWMYDSGEGVTQDYTIAKKWYEKAAKEGYSTAMYNLGDLHYYGNGVPKDYSQAKIWFEKAAEKGDPDAMFTLGWMYDDGQGVTQNYKIAKTWYEKAAEKGNDIAMNNLGVLYKNGQGVTQNYTVAKTWYEKAAQKENREAFYNLGFLYENGLGVTKDYTVAKTWYEKAADKGDTDAMNSLGIMYDLGIEVNQDLAKAEVWYSKAANLGHEVAIANLKRIKDKG